MSRIKVRRLSLNESSKRLLSVPVLNKPVVFAIGTPIASDHHGVIDATAGTP